MKRLRGLIAAVTVVTCLLPCALRADDRTGEAIDRGIAFLLPDTEKYLEGLEGRGAEPNQKGELALRTYALVVAGVSVQNPTIQKAFQYLSKIQLDHIYTISCYVFALDAAISQQEGDLLMLKDPKVQAQFRDNPAIGQEYRPRLQEGVNTILRGQNKLGVWRYTIGAQDFDNSNVQFAVLALGVGAKRRIPIDKDVWLKVVQHFVKGQQQKGPEVQDRIKLQPQEEWGRKKHQDEVKVVAKDAKGKGSGNSEEKEGAGKRNSKGDTSVTRPPPNPENPEIGTENIQVFSRGWDYENKGGATWNMTCSGLSSLLLARDSLRGQIAGAEKDALDKAIRDGYGSLMAGWNFAGNYYGSYSLEKVADIGHVKMFGPHDWYKEMEDFLLGAQTGNGSWPQEGHGSGGVSTSFALLILNRATVTTLLTMNPASRIMISGRTSSGEDPNDRSWVYVPLLDTSVHYPSLLRAIRLRPSAELLKFLENIIENYPDERKGELIPELAAVRKELPNKAAQKYIDEYLTDITGSKYKEYDSYMKWYRRWLSVVEIGTKQKKERIPDLLKYYQNTNQSVPLKKTIMWALQQLKVREAIPLFLDDLNNPEPVVRLAAYNTFKGYFIDYPPAFSPEASPAERQAQVAAIRAWYEKQPQK
jgi:hypothetical protein